MAKDEGAVGDTTGDPRSPQDDLELRVVALEDKLASIERYRDATELADDAIVRLMRYGKTHSHMIPPPGEPRDGFDNLPDWFLSNHC